MGAKPLDGRTALVTGGGTGIGLGCARALLADGASVTIAGRRADVLEAAVASLRAAAPDGAPGTRGAPRASRLGLSWAPRWLVASVRPVAIAGGPR